MTRIDVAVTTPSDEPIAQRRDRSLAKKLVDQAKADGRSLVDAGAYGRISPSRSLERTRDHERTTRRVYWGKP